MSNASARGALPPESRAADWSGWKLSDANLMLEYGVTRKVARVARERAGAPSLPRGRRRGTSSIARSVKPLPASYMPAAATIAARIGEQSRPGRAAGSKELVADRIRALHEAHTDGDPNAVDDAIIEAAAALGLWLDHRRRLRAA